MTVSFASPVGVVPLDELHEAAQSLHAVAQSLAMIAADVGDQAAQATRYARRSVEEAQATMEAAQQLVDQAGLIDGHVQHQQELIHESRNSASEGAEALRRLTGSADSIGSISTMIGGIARQSRLLALNARIEAARAGEFGRGLGVVASEVRELSEQTADATRDIDARTYRLRSEMEDIAGIFKINADRADEARTLADEVTVATAHQCSVANGARGHSADSVIHAEQATIIVGKLATSASTVGMIAQQILHLSAELAEKAKGGSVRT